MEKNSASQDRAKSYAVLAKLKRKIIQMLKDKEEEKLILQEIENAGYSSQDSQKLLIEMKIERIDEIMRNIRITIVIGILIAAGAALMVYLWDDHSRSGRGYNYFVGAMFLPVLFLAFYLYYRLERNSLRSELKNLTTVTQ